MRKQQPFFLWVTPKSPISCGTHRTLIPTTDVFVCRKDAWKLYHLPGEKTGPLLLESRRADFSNFFHYLKFLLSDHSKLHQRCSIYCTKLIYFYKKKSTCSLPWKQGSTRWPSGARSWQDPFLLLHSLPQIHLHMRISAPHHQGKAQLSLASAVAPQKYAERKRICFPMFEG